MVSTCRITMLGGLRISQNDPLSPGATRVVTRFSTYKASALLAYLAFYIDRSPHPREILAGLLWPEAEREAGLTSLRQAIASIRRQIEPTGVPHGSVLIANRLAVQLNPLTVVTDVQDFEAFATADTSASEERIQRLRTALSLYQGELLPGHYEDWIVAERQHMAAIYTATARDLAAVAEQAGDFSLAADTMRLAVNADPLDEEAQHALIRLLAASGQRGAALRQYAGLTRLLEDTFSTPAQPATRALAEKILRSRSPIKAADEKATIPDGEKPFTMAPAQRGVTAPITPPSNLPVMLTRFFGREEEMEQAMNLLQSNAPDSHARLVTITGPGGAGKTRLAIEVARRLAAKHAWRAMFVPLAEVSDAGRLLCEISAAMNLPPANDIDALEQIAAVSIERSLLLVLDNFDMLAMGEGGRELQRLLERLPTLRCLATSRHRTCVLGERHLPLAPLPVPEPSAPPERLLQFPAVQLFADRAQSIRPDFQVTEGNAHAIATLCCRLDGLPLALELAASWAQTLAPSQILSRLTERLDLLSARHHHIAAGHQSLRAVLDSSCRLLPPKVRHFFARLSVFSGGWTIGAAEFVCHASEVMDHLALLQERSLLTSEETDEGMRYRMLDTVREYAAEQLSSDRRALLSLRHSDYYLTLAEEGDLKLRGREQACWLARLEAEQENMRAVLNRREGTTVLRLAGALGRFWLLRGHWAMGRQCLEQALADGANCGPPHKAKAYAAAASLAWALDEYEDARRLAEQSLQAYRTLDDVWGTAYALSLLGIISVRRGESVRAGALLEESLNRFREVGDTWGIAYALDHNAILARSLGQYERAASLLDSSLTLRRKLGDQQGIAISLSSLGDIAEIRGDWETAAMLHGKSLDLFRALGDKAGTAYALGQIGTAAFHAGDCAQAERLCLQSLARFWEIQDRRRVARALEAIAQILVSHGAGKKAVRLLSASASLRAAIGAALPPDQAAGLKRRLSALRANLGQREFDRAWLQGNTMGLENALADALQPQV